MAPLRDPSTSRMVTGTLTITYTYDAESFLGERLEKMTDAERQHWAEKKFHDKVRGLLPAMNAHNSEVIFGLPMKEE